MFQGNIVEPLDSDEAALLEEEMKEALYASPLSTETFMAIAAANVRENWAQSRAMIQSMNLRRMSLISLNELKF